MTEPTSFDPWHLLHAAWGLIGVICAWIFRNHLETDEKRFDALTAGQERLNARLTTIADNMGTNHAEILKLLLKQ